MELTTQAFADRTLPDSASVDGSTRASGRAARSAPVRFLLHYGEMMLVMSTGMGAGALALVLVGVATGYGYSDLKADAPALVLAGMGVSMTAPMVWWMRRRGHSWAANRAMAISMIAPTVAAIVLLAMGAVADVAVALEVQHIVMFPGMFVAMLLYRGEYTHAH